MLGKAFLSGRDLANAEAQVDTQGVGWVVVIDFTSTGSRLWADFTTQNVNKQVAPITGGATRINGGSGGFTKEQAEELVDRLSTR